MRALPVPVRLYPAETVSSYFSRLCLANRISEYEVWRALKQEDPGLGPAVAPRTAIAAIEELGGLRHRTIAPPADISSTCKHDPTMWVRACRFCNGAGFGPTTLCRRCTAGDLVFVDRITGPICVKHARWHSNGLDIDIRAHPASLRSQTKLNGSLHQRSIGYRSPVAFVSRDIVNGWWHPARLSKEEIGLEDELRGLPRLVETMTVLTSPTMHQLLTHDHASHRAIAGVLMRIGAVARSGDNITRFAETISVDEHRSSFRIGGETWPLSSPRSGPALEAPEKLWRRILTVRAALLQHRNLRTIARGGLHYRGTGSG